jgi:hypothetical protein
MSTPVRIDKPTQLIHEGRAFTALTGGTLDVSDTATLAMMTPTDKDVHLRFSSQFTGETAITYYKNATCTGGTPLVSFNKNFQSSETPELALKVNPTITVAGDQIVSTLYGSGHKSGGNLTWDSYVLARDTTYVMTLVSAAVNNTFSTQFIWVEL